MRSWSVRGGRSLLFAAAVLACLSMASDSHGRKWKPSATSAAQEYLKIQHQISQTESIFVIWLAPQYFLDDAANETVRRITRDYVVLVFIHVSVSQRGEWSFLPPSDITVEVGDSEVLKPLASDQLPPDVAGSVDTMKSSMKQGLGKLGEGMQILTYEGSKVDSCRDGVIWVPYQGERYEFRTPLPGCS